MISDNFKSKVLTLMTDGVRSLSAGSEHIEGKVAMGNMNHILPA